MKLKEIQPTGKKDTRSGFGDGIVQAAEKNERIVALTADLMGSLKLNEFVKRFPDRYIQCGIASLGFLERTPRPIGALLRLVEFHAQKLLQEISE